MTRLILLFTVIFSACADGNDTVPPPQRTNEAPAPQSDGHRFTGKIVDGDTIHDTEYGKLRLAWIDTPETRNNSHGPGMTEGLHAKSLLEKLIPEDKMISVSVYGTDRYERKLAIVHFRRDHGWTTAQGEIIEAGWSPVWTKYSLPPAKWMEDWSQRQAEARQKGRGMWTTNPAWMECLAKETKKEICDREKLK